MAKLNLTLTVEGMPVVLAMMRKEMAQRLLEMAEDQSPEVAACLREAAFAFEAGQAPNGYDA